MRALAYATFLCCLADHLVAGAAPLPGDRGRAVYDPVIDVLNTGTVLEAKPLVSADRKYVTIGGIRAQHAGLAGTFIEEINALGAEGAGQLPVSLLTAAWTGTMVPAGGSSSSPHEVSLDLEGQICGRFVHKLVAVRLIRCSLATRTFDLQLTVRKPGRPRRLASGRLHEEHLRKTVICRLVADETWTTLSGPCAGELGRGEVELTRVEASLPGDLAGSWIGEPRALRGAIPRGDDARCDLVADAEGWRLLLGRGQVVTAAPLEWDAAKRRLLLLLTFPPVRKSAKPKVGILEGCFSEDLAKFGAWFAKGSPVTGPVLFETAASTEAAPAPTE